MALAEASMTSMNIGASRMGERSLCHTNSNDEPDERSGEFHYEGVHVQKSVGK